MLSSRGGTRCPQSAVEHPKSYLQPAIHLGVMIAAVASSALSFAATAPISVYILAGQSNMDGRAHQKDLPARFRESRRDIAFYFDDAWKDLAPGASKRPAPPDGFGPELSFGDRMAAARKGGQKIALIKHSPGGTSLAVDWLPEEGPQLQALVKKVRAAMAALEKTGAKAEISGLVWMQGERDASTVADAKQYRTRLVQLIAYLRQTFNEPDLPIVIGRINAPGREAREIVRAAQGVVAASVPHVELVRTDDLPLLDVVHYDAAGLVTLGELFAEAMLKLESRSKPSP